MKPIRVKCILCDWLGFMGLTEEQYAVNALPALSEWATAVHKAGSPECTAKYFLLSLPTVETDKKAIKLEMDDVVQAANCRQRSANT